MKDPGVRQRIFIQPWKEIISNDVPVDFLQVMVSMDFNLQATDETCDLVLNLGFPVSFKTAANPPQPRIEHSTQKAPDTPAADRFLQKSEIPCEETTLS